MSDILSRVQILLDANTAKFEQNIKSADKTATSTFSNISSKAKMMGAAVAVASVAAINGLVNFTNQQVETINEIERFAKLADATPEQFQKMSIGADALGINQEKLSDQMKDFNEKIGEFISLGSGGAADFFEQIATKTEGSAAGARKLALEIQALSGPKGLQLMFDKMEQFGATNKQESFFLESMASDTTALIPLLKDGGKGFDEWAQAAEKAGVIMNDETRAAAVELKSQTKLLELQYQGLKAQVAQSVIPAFLDLSTAFNQSAADGYDVVSMADVLGNVLRGLGVIANTVSMSFKLTGNSLGGLLAAADAATNDKDVPWYWKTTSGLLMGGWAKSKEATTIVSSMANDNAKIMDEYAKANEIILNGQTETLSKYAKQAAEAKANIGKNDFKGMDDWVAKTDKVKDAQDKLNKKLADQNKLYDEQKRIRDSLIYDFSDRKGQMQIDYDRQLADISKAGFDNSDYQKFADVAKARFEDEQTLYKMKMMYELSEHKLNEEAKLQATFIIDQQEIAVRRDIDSAEKRKFLDSLQEKHVQAMRWLNLEKAQRLNDAQQIFQTEMQNMNARYEFERQKLVLDTSIDDFERNTLIGASYRNQDREYDSGRTQTWLDYQGQIGIDTGADTAATQRAEAIQKAYEWQLVTQEEYQRRLLQSEQQYHLDRLNLSMNSYGNTLNATVGFFKGMLGESSNAYYVLYEAQRSYALAQAGMNVWKAASDAYANEPGTVWNKLAAAGIATLKSSAFVDLIASATPQGIFHGGADYVPKESSYLLDKGERVLSPRQNQDLTNYLANQGGTGTGSGDVNIQVNVTDSGVNTSGASTENQKQLGQMLGNMVRTIIRQEQRQGGLLSK
ncbi:hypothetical protein [Acinetobacter ursingii]|uniref:hypothetical protein n=1 Tax=Acinetobacter ursingii TaxID=108980 RepID=UPI001D1838C1|nr:hypothetical protein [Acinetobacter ursingii]